ncbi:rhodanese-like domain-containing protein [Aliisedimentitalea scapharcae]|uniref:Rhodanese-like domain-containing protein n=1 Tax=Aliisedimentitalea scapharcae TaxID=1524259 RepID=A0ABZ2XQG6_9RHOB
MRESNKSHSTLSRRKVIVVGAVGAAALVGGAWWRRQAPDYDGGKLTVAQAHQQAKSGAVILIDIRTPREWRATGIGDGAHPIDMRRDDFVAALQSVAGSDPSAPIALICARGVRSARMSLRLSAAGFSNIIDVPEGMLGSGAGPGWIRAGLPVEKWQETQG